MLEELPEDSPYLSYYGHEFGHGYHRHHDIYYDDEPIGFAGHEDFTSARDVSYPGEY